MKKSILLAMAIVLFGGCTPQPAPPPQACLTSTQLSSYGYDSLARVANLLREDKKNIDTFDGFIGAMKVTVHNYSDMIKSSVYISNVVRFLPIPYAGEISNTTKLISKTALHLNVAADALDHYKKSSATFLDGFDKLSPTESKPADLARLATFADSQLLHDAQELELALQQISSSTATMAATTQSISNALETTGNYVNNVKSFVGFSQTPTTTASSSDKVKVNESQNSINAKMIQLNQKIVALEHSADTYRLNIEKARIYTELAVQLGQ